MKRLLFITDAFRPLLGGVATSAWRICAGLAAEGARLAVLTQQAAPPGPPREEWPGIEVWRFAHAGYPCHTRDFLTLGFHRLLEEPEEFAAVISFQATAAALLGSLVAGSRGCPHLVCCRGSDIQRKAAGDPALAFSQALALGRASAVAAVSPEIEQRLLALGVSRQRLRLIPNAVDSGRFQPSGAPPDYDFLLAGPGRSFKGFSTVLEAAATLPGPCRILALIYPHASEPDHLRQLRALAGRLPAAVRVDFQPPLPHAEMPAAYNRARCLIQPSNSEGCSNVVLEAMACGRRLLLRDIPALRQLGGGAADYFSDAVDLAEKMRAALASPFTPSAAAREEVQRAHAPQREIAAYRGLLEDLIAGRER